MDDYYELLDVAPDAARDDIRGAYRAKREALQANEGDQTRAKVAELNRAWNVLSDPAQRERYDQRLAEHRESGDGDYDDDEAEEHDRPVRRKERPVPVTRAGRREAAREARTGKRQTIVLPDGLEMAAVRSRLSALGIDLLVLAMIFTLTQVVGLKLIDNKYPGQRSLLSHTISQENDASSKVKDDAKKVSTAQKALAAAKLKHDTAAEAKANAAITAGKAAQAKDQKRKDQLNAQVTKINNKLAPSGALLVAAIMVFVLLYTVPSTAVSGQTLGKRLQRIRVAHLDGSRPGLSTAFTRFGVPTLIATILYLPLHFGPLGFAVAVLGMIGWISQPNRQGLHDRLAKTVVVEA